MTFASASMRNAPTIVWFRQDLRLQDNPALTAAVAGGGPVVPVYILDEAGEGRWPAGGASRWWLHHSLAALDASLLERGSRLVLARGESAVVLDELIETTGAKAVNWNRRYEPAIIARDKSLKAGLAAKGVAATSFNAALLFEPHTVQNKAGGPFQVFTPYWKHCQSLTVEAPVRLPAGPLPAPARWPKPPGNVYTMSLREGPPSGPTKQSSRFDELKAPSLSRGWIATARHGGPRDDKAFCKYIVELDDLNLLPALPWADGFAKVWQPGEAGAMKRLKKFIGGAMAGYAEQRNLPDVDGTSALSPHLHFGDIGPRQIWAAVRALSKDSGVFPANRGAQVFLTEVGWREFAHHLLYHFPATPTQPLRADFAAFPWRKDEKQLRAWRRGLTGYPIVDAGMRQLWTTGWMHNRVRMIVASFLVKHLRLSWQDGAEWFWDTLVDADLAANTLGWQWSAGCGADAAPYFRIFNPILQGGKFDPEGGYVRRWVPELAKLPAAYIHQPWEAPMDVLAEAGLILGRNYPHPIVNHGEARVSALAALKTIRAKAD